MAAVDGWDVPESFGDVAGEYAALRSGCGLLDLSCRCRLQLAGPDRVAFLHNMVTNDLRALVPGTGCRAAQLNSQGKMEAALRIHCRPDALLVDVEPGSAARARAALQQHLVMEDVQVEDVTETWALLAVQGPGAAAALAQSGIDASSLPQTARHREIPFAGAATLVAQSDHCGAGGFDLWVPQERAMAAWRALRTQGGARPVGLRALDVRRIEAGIPWAGAEIQGETFPMEAGLDDGWISYTKGCYLGQEPIARIHHLGHVNRILRGLQLDADTLPAAGARLLHDGKPVGKLTSAARSPRLPRPIGLGYVHRDHAVPGTALAVEADPMPLPARVCSLPFDF
jgi:folate-binding protein YgfZ